MAISLPYLWVLRFIFVCFFMGKEKRMLKHFVKIFYVLLGFFVQRCKKSNWIFFFLLLNLHLILLFSVLESKYKNLHKWNIDICSSLCLYGYVHTLLHKMIKDKNVFVNKTTESKIVKKHKPES